MKLDADEREIARLGSRAGAAPATIARVLRSRRETFAQESAEARSVASASGASAASTDGSDRLVRDSRPIPMWVCGCGARNRLRDTACRNCGADKP